jgi:tRNA dimethylallyltransferase
MDLGTDKPPAEARARVRHHLLDHWPPVHELTVAEFQIAARDAIADISGRGHLPLLVGGSGLYYRAVVDDLSFRPRSREVRSALEEDAARPGGPGRLFARLERLDPVAARRVGVANVRRVIRALEIVELTGGPGDGYERWRSFDSVYDLRVAGLGLDRDVLYRRIASRVDRMLAAGLIEEVRRLGDEGLGSTARQALGYRQILEAPDSPPGELRNAIVRATKRFARRQESWFRADPRVVWFDASEGELAARLAAFFSRAEKSVAPPGAVTWTP